MIGWRCRQNDFNQQFAFFEFGFVAIGDEIGNRHAAFAEPPIAAQALRHRQSVAEPSPRTVLR
jgi:hypothetical protein